MKWRSASSRSPAHRSDRCFRAARIRPCPRPRASVPASRPPWTHWSPSSSKKIPPAVRNPPPMCLANSPRSPIASPLLRASRFRAAFIAIPAVALLLGFAALALPPIQSACQPTANRQSSSSYTQLTSFTDSAVWPVLSPDGRMLAFYRSAYSFFTPDQIWVKLLPDGDPVQVTHDPRQKYGIAFSPDGARIAYSVIPSGPNLFQTYTVSPLGGDSELLLQNSAGLTWLDNGRVMFSQIRGAGVHMGIVTSKTDGSDLREVYLPAHDRGMAHYSYLSPDGKWVLMVEMISSWKPCRVVPFAGGSLGRQVGPPDAPCEAAAWSPDGKWMYLGAQVSGRYHLWRQRFPDGRPEQITFGSNQEDGIAMAPDGRSLITSISTPQIRRLDPRRPRRPRAFHRRIRGSGAAGLFPRRQAPILFIASRFARIARRTVARRSRIRNERSAGAGRFDVRIRYFPRRERCGLLASSPPANPPKYGLPPWIAARLRTGFPRLVTLRRISARTAKCCFVWPKAVRSTWARCSATEPAGARRSRIGSWRSTASPPIAVLSKSAASCRVRPSTATRPELAVPLDGGAPRPICDCAGGIAWAPNGRYLYVQIAAATSGGSPGKTVAIPVPPGQTLPPLPENAVHNPAEWAKVPGVKIVNHDGIAPGPDPSTYAYCEITGHANLYRIPLR